MDNFFEQMEEINLEKKEELIKLGNEVNVSVQWESVNEDDIEMSNILKLEERKYGVNQNINYNKNYKNADINLSFFAFRNGKPQNVSDLVFYNSKNPNAVIGLAPSEREEFENDSINERIGEITFSENSTVYFNKLDSDIDKIAIMVSIYIDKKNIEKKNFTTFGAVKNARLYIWNKNNKDLYKISLTEINSLSVAVLIGEFVKENNIWLFKEKNKGYINERKEIFDKTTGENKGINSVATIITIINDYIKKANNDEKGE